MVSVNTVAEIAYKTTSKICDMKSTKKTFWFFVRYPPKKSAIPQAIPANIPKNIDVRIIISILPYGPEYSLKMYMRFF